MSARSAAFALTIALSACAGAAPRAHREAATPPPSELVAPVGSRVALRLPATLVRLAHSLRWRNEAMEVHIADAQVAPGSEADVAERLLAQFAQRYEGEVTHRPVGIDGFHGFEVTVNGPNRRIRSLSLWREGAISRVTITHAPASATDAERILDSVRFDPTRPIDPIAALGVRTRGPQGMDLIPITNEQLAFRRNGHAVGFPNHEPVLDVSIVVFPGHGRPANDLARGQLLGSRLAGLDLGTPRMTTIHGDMEGFAIGATTTYDQHELAVYGAYLESPEGVALIRASVEIGEAATWIPRFDAFARSLSLTTTLPSSDGPAAR